MNARATIADPYAEAIVEGRKADIVGLPAASGSTICGTATPRC
jgi:hypothetical protein